MTYCSLGLKNDSELQAKEVEKRGLNLLLTPSSVRVAYHKRFFVSKSGYSKEWNKKVSKIGDYNDLEDMVYRRKLPFDEITDILDMKYVPSRRICFTPPPGIYEIIHPKIILKKTFLPKGVKVSVTID